MSQQDTLEDVLKHAEIAGAIITKLPAEVVKDRSGPSGPRDLGHWTVTCEHSYQMQNFLTAVRQRSWGALELRACGVAFLGFEMPDGLRVKLTYLDQSGMGRQPTEALMSLVPHEEPWSVSNLEEIVQALGAHPDVATGNSKVHFAYQKAKSLLGRESEVVGVLRRYIEHIEDYAGTDFLGYTSDRLHAGDRDLIRRLTGKQ